MFVTKNQKNDGHHPNRHEKKKANSNSQIDTYERELPHIDPLSAAIQRDFESSFLQENEQLNSNSDFPITENKPSHVKLELVIEEEQKENEEVKSEDVKNPKETTELDQKGTALDGEVSEGSSLETTVKSDSENLQSKTLNETDVKQEEEQEPEEEKQAESTKIKKESTSGDQDGDETKTVDRSRWQILRLDVIINELLGLDYDEVVRIFKEANGYHVDFSAWIKKSIIQFGWTNYDDPVPDIYEIVYSEIQARDWGVLQTIPVIEAYSFNDAFAAAGRLGLKKNMGQPFFWKTKIKGTLRKYRYNFSSREGWKNYTVIKKTIRENSIFTVEYMKKGFFHDLNYITGKRGEEAFAALMNISHWHDQLLSDELVTLVVIAQQRHNEIYGKNSVATGIIDSKFLFYVKGFKDAERRRKEQELKKQKELQERLKEEEDRKQKHREEYGEPINGNENYRRYYRGSESVEVNEKAYRSMKKALKNRSGSNDAFFKQLAKRGAWVELQQNIFFLLTVRERKTALYFCANANYLNDSREEPSLISILQNTPSGDKERIKNALNQPHGSYQKLQYALKDNVSYDNTKELTIAIDNIVGYGKPLKKSDLTYRINNLIYIEYETVADLTPKQVHRLTLSDFQWFVQNLTRTSYRRDDAEALVNLIIYASSEQQVWLRSYLTEYGLKKMRILKDNLPSDLWYRLRFGETVDKGIDTDFTGQDEKVVYHNRRGSGLENLFHDDQTIFEKAKKILDGFSHKYFTDVNVTLTSLPLTLVKDLFAEDERYILQMINLLTKGSVSSEEENAIMRALIAARDMYDEEEEQRFYYRLGNKNSLYGDLVTRINNKMDDRYEDWRQLASDFNEGARKQRIERISNSTYNDKDYYIAHLSNEDMRALSSSKRHYYISILVGSDSWWSQFTTNTGDRDEDSVIRLINSTPHDQVTALYSYLFKNKGERFEALQSAIDGAEFKKFHETMKQRNFKFLEQSLVGGIDANADMKALQQHQEKLVAMRLAGGDYKKGKEQETQQFKFSDPGSVRLIFGGTRTNYDLSFTNDGRLKITMEEEDNVDLLFDYVAPGINLEKEKSSAILDPMQLITVRHERDDSTLGVSQGDVVVMPAIGLFFYENKANNRFLMEMVDVALILVSAATLGAATGPAMAIIGILEAVTALSDVLLRQFDDKIPKSLKDALQVLNYIISIPAGLGALNTIVGSIVDAVKAVGKFIVQPAFKKLSKIYQKVILLKHTMNKKYLEQIDIIKGTKNLDELDRLESTIRGTNTSDHPLTKSLLDKVEDQRLILNKEAQDAEDLKKIQESVEKQKQPKAESEGEMVKLEGENVVEEVNTNGKPQWLRDAEEGTAFNKVRAVHYPNNEVYLVNPKDPKRYVRLDSYIDGKEIVSRKHTQFSEITESTGLSYIREMKNKYPPGTKIADVPSNVTGANKNLQIGDGIQGEMILEVPVQKGSIPESIIKEANKHKITIRDINGLEYN